MIAINIDKLTGTRKTFSFSAFMWIPTLLLNFTTKKEKQIKLKNKMNKLKKV